jgi:hypothetical protein
LPFVLLQWSRELVFKLGKCFSRLYFQWVGNVCVHMCGCIHTCSVCLSPSFSVTYPATILWRTHCMLCPIMVIVEVYGDKVEFSVFP